MNPIDVFYSWQSLVLAAAVAGLVQAIKTGIDTVYGVSPARRRTDPGSSVKAHVIGREVRKNNAVLTRGLLPLLPIVVGALLATAVPLRPDILTNYAEDKAGNRDWSVYALWGAAIGQFADYIYQQIKRNVLNRFGSSGASNPPPAPASTPSIPPSDEGEDHPNA